MLTPLRCIVLAAGFCLAAGLGNPSTSARDIVLNSADAQRRAEEARLNGRIEEEQYWRAYRSGLDATAANVVKMWFVWLYSAEGRPVLQQ
jgi:hypothetical protein